MSPELPMVPQAPVTPVVGAAPVGAPAHPQPAMLPWKAGTPRTLTDDQIKAWKDRLDRARRFRKQFEPQWERALKRYAKAKYDEDRTDINALLDFSHVETKKSHLFHRTPDVQLAPIDPKDQSIPYAVLLPLRQKYLNHKLGTSGANVKRAMHKTLVDCLAASGRLAVVIGYEQRSRPVPGRLDPATGQPVQVPLWSRCFIERLSPMRVLNPDDFTDTDFDQAPWLAYDGRITVSAAKALGWAIPDDVKGATTKDDARFQHDLESLEASVPMHNFTSIWAKAELDDPEVFNPDLYRNIIFVEGVDQPVKYCDSPNQDITPEGELTDDSMVGNPIHLGVLRDLPDSAFPPCDLTVGEQLSTELNKFRTQLTQGRVSRQPITLVSDQLDPQKAQQIIKERAAIVPAQHIQPGGQQDVVAVVGGPSESRDNFATQDVIKNDWQVGLGASDARAGQVTSGRKVTATEIRTVSGNAAARDQTEKDNFRDYFIAAVRKLDALETRFAKPRDVQKVLGMQGAALYEQWRVLPGRYTYQILPDAGQYMDANERLQSALNAYNLLRKDDRVNPEEVLEPLAFAMNRDPSKLIAPPVDKTMEPPNVSVTVKLMELNDPVSGRVFLDLAANQGIKLSPDTIALMKAAHVKNATEGAFGGTEPIGADVDVNKHGGAADRTEPVNKHATERTGRVQGSVQ